MFIMGLFKSNKLSDHSNRLNYIENKNVKSATEFIILHQISYLWSSLHIKNCILTFGGGEALIPVNITRLSPKNIEILV